MDTMDPILKPLMASPKLDRYIEQLRRARELEIQKRKQFYAEISEDDKAEFINGEAIFHSPIKMRHLVVGKYLLKLLDTWVEAKELGFVGNEKLMIELSRNSYEPDICFFRIEKSDHFTPDQMIFPIPDFVVEILSPSTEKNDRGIKLEDYAAHGIQEYWIVDPDSEFVEQYLLEGEVYDLKHKLSNGEIEAIAVPGFVIPVRAMFDKEENLQALKRLL